MCRKNETRVGLLPLSLTGCSHCHRHQLVCCEDDVGQTLGYFFMQKYLPTLRGGFQSHKITVNTTWHAPAPECTVCYCSRSQNTRLQAAFHAYMMTGDAESLKGPSYRYNQFLLRVMNFPEYATGAHFSVRVYSRTRKEGCKRFFPWPEICGTIHQI